MLFHYIQLMIFIYLSCPWISWILLHTHIHTSLSFMSLCASLSSSFICARTDMRNRQQFYLKWISRQNHRKVSIFILYWRVVCFFFFFSFEIQLQFTLLMELCIETISRNLAWFGEVFGVKLKLHFGVKSITGIGEDV